MNRKIIGLFILVILLIGCSGNDNKHHASGKKIDSRKPMSWGHKKTIYVFADKKVWKYAEQPLKQTLERFLFTTENEKYFEVKHVPIDEMEQFYKFNNLIFMADIQSDEKVSSYIKEIMGEQIKEEINADLVGMYPKENVWANDQFVLFMVGNSEENLLKLNILQAAETFDLFQDKLYERIKRQIYKYDVFSSNSFSAFPWELKIPKNYVLYKKDMENNFISFLARLRNSPDRYISVYYENMDEDRVGKEWIKKTRAEITWKYYDEDEFKDKDVRVERSKLGKYRCWKLSGRWQNMKHAVGGAFQSFAIYDEQTKTAFLIDNSVYFPEGYKIPGLIELEIISRTLEIKKN